MAIVPTSPQNTYDLNDLIETLVNVLIFIVPMVAVNQTAIAGFLTQNGVSSTLASVLLSVIVFAGNRFVSDYQKATGTIPETPATPATPAPETTGV